MQGTKSEVAHKYVQRLQKPTRLGGPKHFESGGQNEKWPGIGPRGYIIPAARGGTQRFNAGGKIRGGLQGGQRLLGGGGHQHFYAVENP